MKELLVGMLQQRFAQLQQEFQQAQAHFMQTAGQLKEAELLLNAVMGMDEPEAKVVPDEHIEEDPTPDDLF